MDHIALLHRREEGSSKISNGELYNLVKTTAPQRVYVNTNPVTQPGVIYESLPLARGTISPLLRVGINRGLQLP